MKNFKYFFVCTLCSIMVFGTALTCASAVSIPQEKKIADKFMAMIKKRQVILKDPIVNHMVRRVGSLILASVPAQPFTYNFYVIDSNVFNAFASPAANIFVYRGLITSLDSIDELAGILAHEIAHAVSRHVSQSIDRSKYIGIGSFAGMLAGAILGGASGHGGGATLMKGSIALGQTAMLAFTRNNETEADEKGIMFLKRTCFSPKGLLTGLLKIRSSDYRGIEAIPDYMKTHPGTGSRIAHVETILSNYVPLPDKPVCKEDFRFDMVKYRLVGLYSDMDSGFALLSEKLRNDPSSAALHYGMGLMYTRKLMMKKAMAQFEKALSINIFDPMILLEMGKLYLADQEPQKALNILDGMDSDPVVGIMAKYYIARSYLVLGQLAGAHRLFGEILDTHPDLYPKTCYYIAKILSIQKKQGLSHYYLGLYYSKINNPPAAVIHLKKALDTLKDKSDIKKAEILLRKLEKPGTGNNVS